MRKSGKEVGALQGIPYTLKSSIDMVEYFTIAEHPSLTKLSPIVDVDLV